MVYQSAIDALLAQARAVLDRVNPGASMMSWQPARS
jgi:hypothetical protein